jgi:hypothetical protein
MIFAAAFLFFVAEQREKCNEYRQTAGFEMRVYAVEL